MELIQALLKTLFGSEQAGGETMGLTIHMVSPTHCSQISRFSTAGGDETRVIFKPALPLDEALLHACKYTGKGVYHHGIA